MKSKLDTNNTGRVVEINSDILSIYPLLYTLCTSHIQFLVGTLEKEALCCLIDHKLKLAGEFTLLRYQSWTWNPRPQDPKATVICLFWGSDSFFDWVLCSPLRWDGWASQGFFFDSQIHPFCLLHSLASLAVVCSTKAKSFPWFAISSGPFWLVYSWAVLRKNTLITCCAWARELKPCFPPPPATVCAWHGSQLGNTCLLSSEPYYYALIMPS